MPDSFVDMVLTSPPYDNLRDYKGYSFPFEDIAKELYRVTKQGGIVVWVVGDATINGSESGTSFRQALYFKEIGFNLHDTMIYKKHNFSNPSSTRYHQIFEYMFVFSKGKLKTFNPIKDKKNIYAGSGPWGKNTFRKVDGGMGERPVNKISEYGMRTNVWEFMTGNTNGDDKEALTHPAIFPERLAADHISTWSNEGDLIYDPFMGSGTTAKMAHLQKRNWIGSEISSEYCELAQKRIQPYLNQTVLF